MSLLESLCYIYVCDPVSCKNCRNQVKSEAGKASPSMLGYDFSLCSGTVLYETVQVLYDAKNSIYYICFQVMRYLI